MKKISSVLLICFIMLSIFSNVFALGPITTLNVIQKSAEVKYLDNDQGYISKNIVDLDADEGKATVELSLSNITQNTSEEKKKYDNTEIFIIVTENIATDAEKLNTYISYIDTLSNKVFAKSSNTKIGIIGMKGTIGDTKIDENGKLITGENDEREVKGTAENAEIAVNLTQNAEDIKNGLQNMNNTKKKYHVNLQAAIRLANNSFSKEVNKLLISLYDGVPSIAIGVESSYTYGGLFSIYSTVEEALVAQHTHVSTKTKSEILTLKNNNVDFILLRPDDTSYDEKWYDIATGNFLTDFDGSPYVKEIYGTLESPTYGKMYSLNNDSLDKVVTEYIYKDIIENIRIDIKSAVIKEYFSDEILENFDISFDDENIYTKDLLENKYILWNIGNITGNKTASLKYTLKIKNMKNEKLLNKIIATSEKTELSYVNYLDVETTAVSTSSPQIQLSQKIEELIATVAYDPVASTTGSVTATIKTNKKVNAVDGWSLSEDGMTLTKVYTSNVNETVHLIDEDNITKDVKISISNIITSHDNTLASGKLPQAGIKTVISIILLVFAIIMFTFSRYRKLKDI